MLFIMMVVVEDGVWRCSVNAVRGANWKAGAAGPQNRITGGGVLVQLVMYPVEGVAEFSRESLAPT